MGTTAGKPVFVDSNDANIVATMNVHGIRTLATQNVADFARFRQMIDLIPLPESPANA